MTLDLHHDTGPRRRISVKATLTLAIVIAGCGTRLTSCRCRTFLFHELRQGSAQWTDATVVALTPPRMLQ